MEFHERETLSARVVGTEQGFAHSRLHPATLVEFLALLLVRATVGAAKGKWADGVGFAVTLHEVHFLARFEAVLFEDRLLHPHVVGELEAVVVGAVLCIERDLCALFGSGKGQESSGELHVEDVKSRQSESEYSPSIDETEFMTLIA